MRELKRVATVRILNDTCMRLSEIASTSPYCAYVTFEHEDSYAKCIAKYPNVGCSRPVAGPRGQAGRQGRVHRAKCRFQRRSSGRTCPLSWWNRLIRVIITTVIVILPLVVSYAMIYQARHRRAVFQLAGGDRLRPLHRQYQQGRHQLHYQHHLALRRANGHLPRVLHPDTAESDGAEGYALPRGRTHQSFTDGDADPLATMTAYKFQNPETSEDAYLCASTESNLSLFFASFATFVVVFVNGGLAVVLRKMVKFERHQTKTGELLSSCFKLFIAQYINTAWLTQLISGDLDLAGGSDAETFSFPDTQTCGSGPSPARSTTTTPSGTSPWVPPSCSPCSSSAPASCPRSTWWWPTRSAQVVELALELRQGLHPQGHAGGARRAVPGSYIPHRAEVRVPIDTHLRGPHLQRHHAPYELRHVGQPGGILRLRQITLLFFYQKPPVINPALPQLVVNALFGAAVVHLANGIWMFGNVASQGRTSRPPTPP